MMRSFWWSAIVLSSTLVAVFAVIVDLGTPLRPIVTFWFLLICPGMSFVGLLGLNDWLTELTLAVALSLALGVITAMAMLYIGAWSPLGGLLALASQSVIGTMLQLMTRFRLSRE